MAVDLCHQNLTTLLWHLYWTDRNKNTPEQLHPELEPFIAWIEDEAPATRSLLTFYRSPTTSASPGRRLSRLEPERPYRLESDD